MACSTAPIWSNTFSCNKLELFTCVHKNVSAFLDESVTSDQEFAMFIMIERFTKHPDILNNVPVVFI